MKDLLPCGHPVACDGMAGHTGDQPGCGWCADLKDLSMLIDHLTRTYDHFSGGRVSKPLTAPEVVFEIADELEQERVDELVRDAVEVAVEEVRLEALGACE